MEYLIFPLSLFVLAVIISLVKSKNKPTKTTPVQRNEPYKPYEPYVGGPTITSEEESEYSVSRSSISYTHLKPGEIFGTDEYKMNQDAMNDRWEKHTRDKDDD